MPASRWGAARHAARPRIRPPGEAGCAVRAAYRRWTARPGSLEAFQIVRKGAQGIAGQLIERRHLIARLDVLAARNPTSHRTDIVGQHAGCQRKAAADMSQVRAQGADSRSTADRMALHTFLHKDLLAQL